MPKRYLVITADIIDSKRNPELLDNLHHSIEKLNKLFEKELAAYFKLYRGDEIQCVLSSPKNLMKIIRNFRYALKPFNIRIGLGKGQIEDSDKVSNNKLVNTNPWENNGQAFYFARESLEYLDKNKIYRKKPRTFLISDKNNKNQELIINALLNMYDLILESWTKAQWDGIITYEKCHNLLDTANELKIKYQTVHKAISKAAWNEIVLCEERLNYFINKL